MTTPTTPARDDSRLKCAYCHRAVADHWYADGTYAGDTWECPLVHALKPMPESPTPLDVGELDEVKRLAQLDIAELNAAAQEYEDTYIALREAAARISRLVAQVERGVLADVVAERARQDAEWGAMHDDEHGYEDWRRFRAKFERRVHDVGMESPFKPDRWLSVTRDSLIKIAALAIAQAESLDRTNPRADRPASSVQGAATSDG